MSGQKNNSLSLRVRKENKHSERNPYLISALKKDTYSGDAGTPLHAGRWKETAVDTEGTASASKDGPQISA